MNFFNAAVPFATALLLGMLICLEIGRGLGIRKLAKDPQLAMSGLGVIESAMFGLYGLLLAFTFSGAPERLDMRRRLIADEANAIGTAYLRLDLLPAESQPALRERFRKYLDSRLEIYRDSGYFGAAKTDPAKSSKLQRDIWSQAVVVTQQQGAHPEAGRLLLPALNEMIDITTTRTMATRMHPPLVVYELIFLLALVCSLLAGYGMARTKQRSWLHIVAFAMVTVISVYAFLEIEYPRLGFIRLLGASDQVLFELRDSMH